MYDCTDMYWSGPVSNLIKKLYLKLFLTFITVKTIEEVAHCEYNKCIKLQTIN